MTRSRKGAELLTAYESGSLSFKNRIINGAMKIDQRASSYTGSGYSLDRWYLVILGSATVTQSSSAPAGFANSYLWTTNSASTPSNVAYYNGFGQLIEGYNVSDFGWGTASASPATLSFYVKANNTGTYPLTINNATSSGSINGAARSYVTSYTVTTANTWQKITVTIPGDTSGTWATNNSAGISIWFDSGSGSNYATSTTNAWQSGAYLYPSGCLNLQNTASATLAITGVQLEKGSTATSFDYRDYGRELQMCQRYLPAFYGQGIQFTGVAASSTQAYVAVQFPVPVRAPATGVVVNAASAFNISDVTTQNAPATGLSFNFGGQSGAQIYATIGGGLTAARCTQVFANSATSNIYFTGCEL